MDYTRKFFEDIEEKNKEFNDLFYGPVYNKGVQVNTFKEMIASFDLKGFWEAVMYKISGRKLNKFHKISVCKQENNNLKTYDSYIALKSMKIVVYTCIVGKYDFLKEPLLEFDNVEYICFTDNENNINCKNHTKWKIKIIPQNILSKYNKTLSNRYVKMHAAELFKDADYAIYVDGNVKINSFLGTFVMATSVKSGIAIFEHSQRSCAYDESDVCIIRKKGNKSAIEQQMKRYKEDGFPKGYGLYECTIIATDLNNPDSSRIMEDWWQEFVDSKSFRDQLSLPYVMWKNGFEYTDIGLLGANIFEDNKITVYGHK